MAGRDLLLRSEPGISLPAIERVAPSVAPELLASHIEALSSPGDIVLDLNGRGGWVARTAVDRQRRAVSIESSPLTRLVAEVVLRPPDIRHLDAAFQAIGTAPRGQSSLKVALGEMFATRCPTCGRMLVADEFIWEAIGEERRGEVERGDDSRLPDGGDDGARPPSVPRARLVRRHFRCSLCRDQVGGGEQRHAAVDEADLVRAAEIEPRSGPWAVLHERFPTLDGHDQLVDQLLELHTPRQLVALAAILERLDADLRAAPVEAALRLALLHALLPASRLNGYPGRVAALRIVNGRVKVPSGALWRERNPWLAFEDGYRLVRGFVQRLEGTALGPLQARLGDDLRSLVEGATTAVLKVGTPATFRSLAAEGPALGRLPGRPAVRLVLGQPPSRPSQERLSFTYLATAWLLGRESAASLPLEPLFGLATRAPWGWQVAAVRRQLAAVEPLVARDARVVLLAEPGGPEAVVAAVLGGVGAGYRLVGARFAEPGEEIGGTVEFVPPGAPLPRGARTRGDRVLEPVPGGAGDPDVVPGRGLFAPPERFDRSPLTRADIERTVTETAVGILKARGEPAGTERLLGEILVGLDQAGQLRRLVGPDADPSRLAPAAGATSADEPGVGRPVLDLGEPAAPRASASRRHDGGGPPHLEPARREGILDAARRPHVEPVLTGALDQVDALLGMIRAELTRPDQRRLRQIAPERWWLASRPDEEAAATPLADRVEWAVFSLLSTAGRLSESAFLERIAAMFSGHDLPDEALVRACLESYRSRASTPDSIQTADDLVRRSHEHGELVALLADLGHRLGLGVWIGLREQERRIGGRPLASWLDDRERRIHLSLVARGPAEELEQVDCIWYLRHKVSFLFEVEWTAMLHEPVLRRGPRIPQSEEVVRFLVVLPERVELVRHKLDRSPLLREALEAGNWHILKANHLRTFAARDEVALADLEPYLGLDPPADRSGEQMPLFE